MLYKPNMTVLIIYHSKNMQDQYADVNPDLRSADAFIDSILPSTDAFAQLL